MNNRELNLIFHNKLYEAIQKWIIIMLAQNLEKSDFTDPIKLSNVKFNLDNIIFLDNIKLGSKSYLETEGKFETLKKQFFDENQVKKKRKKKVCSPFFQKIHLKKLTLI